MVPPLRGVIPDGSGTADRSVRGAAAAAAPSSAPALRASVVDGVSGAASGRGPWVCHSIQPVTAIAAPAITRMRRTNAALEERGICLLLAIDPRAGPAMAIFDEGDS